MGHVAVANVLLAQVLLMIGGLAATHTLRNEIHCIVKSSCFESVKLVARRDDVRLSSAHPRYMTIDTVVMPLRDNHT